MIRKELIRIVQQALDELAKTGQFDLPDTPKFVVERTREKGFGDWSTNIAMTLASSLRQNPLKIADTIISTLSYSDGLLKDVKVAKPGFINFYLTDQFLRNGLVEIQKEEEKFGRSTSGKGKCIQIEFVSANPTGPLHIGHGRWAAVGDTLANVLEAAGFKVEREFYINDYGRQMMLFGESIAVRYAQIFGQDREIPEEGYQGSYIKELAQEIADRDSDKYLSKSKEEQAKLFKQEGEKLILENFKEVFASYGVKFDVWFSETKLHESGEIDKAIKLLEEHGYVYKDDGASWLRTTEFGDDKDRVIVRENGEPTYFASDIAYHLDKFERGFDTLINVWGADHHGYVARVKAAVQALGYSPDSLEIIIGQLVNLYRHGEPVRMSKRTGELVTFSELIEEVGSDVARYIFLTRSTNSPLDFDIDLAKQQSQENPVYYVQYAHARIASILKFAAEQEQKMPASNKAHLSLLVEEAELDLMRHLIGFPEFLEDCANLRAPYKLTQYAEELAALFHVFYTKCRVVTDDSDLSGARLFLIRCTQIVLRNTLELLGVSVPESM